MTWSPAEWLLVLAGPFWVMVTVWLLAGVVEYESDRWRDRFRPRPDLEVEYRGRPVPYQDWSEWFEVIREIDRLDRDYSSLGFPAERPACPECARRAEEGERLLACLRAEGEVDSEGTWTEEVRRER